MHPAAKEHRGGTHLPRRPTGGCGASLEAPAHGIALVIGVQSEDKVEVAARLAWTGVALNLAAETRRGRHPAAASIVTGDPAYRAQARRLQAESGGITARNVLKKPVLGTLRAGSRSWAAPVVSPVRAEVRPPHNLRVPGPQPAGRPEWLCGHAGGPGRLVRWPAPRRRRGGSGPCRAGCAGSARRCGV